MISFYDAKLVGNKYTGTITGLSSDTKPLETIANGCVFLEMDTKKVYLYDEANATWRQFSA